MEEQIAASAYLDLLLRSVTEPGLLMSLIKFLLEVIYDGKRILHILIQRIKDNSRVTFHFIINVPYLLFCIFIVKFGVVGFI